LQNEFPDLFQYLKESKVTLYKGKGCPSCNNSGYKGRMAVFEFIQINAELKELFLKHPSTNELWSLARQFGATSMFEDGLEKVLSGLTSLPELYRVAQPPTHINYQKK